MVRIDIAGELALWHLEFFLATDSFEICVQFMGARHS